MDPQLLKLGYYLLGQNCSYNVCEFPWEKLDTSDIHHEGVMVPRIGAQEMVILHEDLTVISEYIIFPLEVC